MEILITLLHYHILLDFGILLLAKVGTKSYLENMTKQFFLKSIINHQNIFRFIALAISVAILILYLFGLFGVFVLMLVTPFFIAMILFFIAVRRHPLEKQRKVFIRVLLACIIIDFLFLAFITTIGLRLFLSIASSNRVSSFNTNDFARCSWLGGVPKAWYCKDAWVDDERHLMAYNPSDENQQIELQIQGTKRYLRIPCTNLIPVENFMFVSPSGLTIPYLCYTGKQMLYRADWSQDGYHFRLLGHNISKEFYIENLERIYSNYTPDDANLTMNSQVKVEPTNVPLGVGQLKLLNINLCRKRNDRTLELREQPKIWLMPGKIPVDFKLEESSFCTIILRLDSKSVKIGSYNVMYEVNGLRQWLKDPINIF